MPKSIKSFIDDIVDYEHGWFIQPAFDYKDHRHQDEITESLNKKMTEYYVERFSCDRVSGAWAKYRYDIKALDNTNITINMHVCEAGPNETYNSFGGNIKYTYGGYEHTYIIKQVIVDE